MKAVYIALFLLGVVLVVGGALAFILPTDLSTVDAVETWGAIAVVAGVVAVGFGFYLRGRSLP